MMTLLRERMVTIFVVLAVAFIITIVFDWGMGGFQSGMKPGVIGTVNGVEITRDQYQQALDNRFNYERQANPNQEITDARRRQLRGEVWDGLVSEILIEEYLDRHGVQVTQSEVTFAVRNNPPSYIRNDPNFTDSLGRFNERLYLEILTDPEYSGLLQNIEDNARRSLRQQRLFRLIQGPSHISDNEVRAQYIRENTKATASYVLIPWGDMLVDTSLVTDAAILQDYEARKDEEYRVEAKRTALYVTFPDEPSRDDTLDARAICREIQERLADGESFESLAIEYSDDSSAPEGGDLGWFRGGQMVAPFDSAAFLAPVGEVVGPVLTRYGYHLIKIEQRGRIARNSTQPDSVRGRHILIRVEQSIQTRDDIASRADGFRQEAEETSFAQAAEIYGLEVDTLENIRESGLIPRFGRNQALTDFLFRQNLGEVSPVYVFRQGYTIFQAIEAFPGGYRPLDEVRETIRRDLLKEFQFEAAGEVAADIYAQVATQGTLEAAASALGYEVQTTPREFKVDEFISGGVGRDYAFATTAMGLDVGEVSEPFRGTKGFYIVRLEEKDEAVLTGWETRKQTTLNQMLRQRQQELYTRWVEQEKEDADIEDNRYYYYTEF